MKELDVILGNLTDGKKEYIAVITVEQFSGNVRNVEYEAAAHSISSDIKRAAYCPKRT